MLARPWCRGTRKLSVRRGRTSCDCSSVGHTLGVQSEDRRWSGWYRYPHLSITTEFQPHHAPESQVWWSMLVTPTLGRWRQGDPWGLPARQPNLLGELLAVSNYLKNPRWTSPGATLYSALISSTIWLGGCRLSHRADEGHSLIPVHIHHLERAHLQRSQAAGHLAPWLSIPLRTQSKELRRRLRGPSSDPSTV